MKIGDRCFVHGYIDEIRKDTVIIKNKGGYFGTDPGEVIVVNDTAHPNWIPVSARLPEDNTRVLVTFACGKVGTSSWHKSNTYNNGFDAVMYGITKDGEHVAFGVDAWMPLPEPWKGEPE